MSERVLQRKDPQSIEWSRWMPWARRLGAATIVSSSWDGGGLTVEDDEVSGTETRVKLSGGAVDTKYRVTNRVVTSTGETIDWGFFVRVSDDSAVVRSKDPDSIEIFSVRWATKLGEDVAIDTSNFTVPAGLTKTSQTLEGQAAKVKLSGGTAGVAYQVKNTITTDDGQTLVYRFEIRVSQQ